jgi:hypothetical protein
MARKRSGLSAIKALEQDLNGPNSRWLAELPALRQAARKRP